MIKSPLSNIVDAKAPEVPQIIEKEPDCQPLSIKKSNLSINHLDFNSLVRSPSSVPKNQGIVLSSGKTLANPLNGVLNGETQHYPAMFNQLNEENDLALPQETTINEMLVQTKCAHRFSTSSSYYNFGDEIEEQQDESSCGDVPADANHANAYISTIEINPAIKMQSKRQSRVL